MAAGDIWIPPFDANFVDQKNPFDAVLEIQKIINPIRDLDAQYILSQELLHTMMPLTEAPAGLDNALVASSRYFYSPEKGLDNLAELLYEQAVIGEIKGFARLPQPMGRRCLLMAVSIEPKYKFSLAHPAKVDQIDGKVLAPIDRVHYIELGKAA